MKANFPGVEVLGAALNFRKRQKIRHPLYNVLQKKREIRHFPIVISSDGKEMYQKVCCTCRVFFCQSVLKDTLKCNV